MLQGVSRTARKRHNKAAPDFLQGVMLRTQQCHTLITSKGAISASRQRHFSRAPTSFIWCQLRIAAMPLDERTKGRVTISLQKCHADDTLPTQFNGVIVKTQKCLDIVAPREKPYRSRRNADVVALLPASYRGSMQSRSNANLVSPPQITGDTDMTQQCLDRNPPRERPNKVRRNAIIVPPLPTSLTGAITTSQKCYKVNAPREGSSQVRSNANRFTPFPTSYRGPFA